MKKPSKKEKTARSNRGTVSGSGGKIEGLTWTQPNIEARIPEKAKKPHRIRKVISTIGSKIFAGAVIVVVLTSAWVQMSNIETYTSHFLFGFRDHSIPIDLGALSAMQLPDSDSVGTCESKDIEASVEVYVAKDLGDDDGYFTVTEHGPIIALRSTPTVPFTELIAHEVSHFVDAVVNTKGIKDTETRAYLQGYFTQCVNDLLVIRYDAGDNQITLSGNAKGK